MSPLPLTVIGGYLGAGKTTLINRLLTADHGLRLAVLVNDFGQINIDAALLQSASEDTIELANGCICCTMSGDLFYAIGDILDRPAPPDHVIVEASGIADPAKIAAVALAEPELRYAGILTVADGLNLPALLGDPAIAPQLQGQLGCADLIAVSKTPADDTPIAKALRNVGVAHWVCADDDAAVNAFLFDDATPKQPRDAGAPHPSYAQWSDPAPAPMTRAEIEQRLATRPSGIVRLKGIVPAPEGAAWEIHVVGRQSAITTRPVETRFGVTALGISSAITAEAIANWWQAGS